MFPWQHGVLKLCEEGNAVLDLNCYRKFLNMISEIRLVFL